MCLNEAPEPFRDLAMVRRDDGGMRDRQTERLSKQHDDGVPIREAADRCRLREGGEKPEARVVALEELRDDKNREARDQNPAGQPFGSLELAQSRAIVRVGGRCGQRFSALASNRRRPLHHLLPARRSARYLGAGWHGESAAATDSLVWSPLTACRSTSFSSRSQFCAMHQFMLQCNINRARVEYSSGRYRTGSPLALNEDGEVR